jgi:hypothetical protein
MIGLDEVNKAMGMSYFKGMVFGLKPTTYVLSTNEPVDQAWQQLVLLRHVSASDRVFKNEAHKALVDQAKIYFLDARKSNWRSGGLLYYYSYLNLAKAVLFSKGIYGESIVRSASLLHGLSTKPQSTNEIPEFELTIHPKSSGATYNVFAALYEAITGTPWPFEERLTIQIGVVMPYCTEISLETKDFYGMEARFAGCQSLYRTSRTEGLCWYEFLVPRSCVAWVVSDVGADVLGEADMTELDRDIWLTAYGTTNATLSRLTLVRSQMRPYDERSAVEVFRDVVESLRPHAVPLVEFPPEIENWLFVRKLDLKGKSLFWHPLLSDYLFSYVLSTILRYYPHLMATNGRDAYISEAWCKQGAEVALRYFLLEFTTPGIIVRKI